MGWTYFHSDVGGGIFPLLLYTRLPLSQRIFVKRYVGKQFWTFNLCPFS